MVRTLSPQVMAVTWSHGCTPMKWRFIDVMAGLCEVMPVT